MSNQNPFKTGGPETSYVTEDWVCCRIWPVITKTLTWNAKDEYWKKESQWVRRCGYCGEYPRPMEET